MESSFQTGNLSQTHRHCLLKLLLPLVKINLWKYPIWRKFPSQCNIHLFLVKLFCPIDQMGGKAAMIETKAQSKYNYFF